MSRYLRLESSPGKCEIEQLRVLTAVAAPDDSGRDIAWPKHLEMNGPAELRALSETLNGLKAVSWKAVGPPVTSGAIDRNLREFKPHVLHLVAHGWLHDKSKTGYVLLENEDGGGERLDEHELAGLVSGAGLQLVVLATCYSAERSDADAFVGLAPRMMEQNVPAVVAMQDRISSAGAGIFTETFYSVLTGLNMATVDAAMNAARRTLYHDAPAGDWAIPVLFMRGSGDLFSRATPASEAQTASASTARAKRAAAQSDTSHVQKTAYRKVGGDPNQRLRIIEVLLGLADGGLSLVASSLEVDIDAPEDPTPEGRIQLLVESCSDRLDHLETAAIRIARKLELREELKKRALENLRAAKPAPALPDRDSSAGVRGTFLGKRRRAAPAAGKPPSPTRLLGIHSTVKRSHSFRKRTPSARAVMSKLPRRLTARRCGCSTPQSARLAAPRHLIP